MKKPSISLILPCYNEEEHILVSCEKIIAVLKSMDLNFEIVFVDDKSTDRTRLFLRQIKAKYSALPIKIVIHNKNSGRGVTVADGIRKAKAEIVGFIDIDCEISPRYIPVFIRYLGKGYDIVTAKRIYEFKLFSINRYVASKIYSYLVKLIFNLPISDTEAGYKFFKRKRILPLLGDIKDKHWFWDTEILVKAERVGLKIKELPTLFIKRNDKTSTVKLIPDTIRYINNIIRLKLEMMQ